MTKEEIKDSVSLEEVISGYGVRLNRQRFVCCPFHNDKNPSMKIYPNNTFFCFGCGASGDVIKFVEMFEGISFKDAFIKLGGTYDHLSKKELATRKRDSVNSVMKDYDTNSVEHKKQMIHTCEQMLEKLSDSSPEWYDMQWFMHKLKREVGAYEEN